MTLGIEDPFEINVTKCTKLLMKSLNVLGQAGSLRNVLATDVASFVFL